MAIALVRKVELRGDMVAFAAWLMPDGATVAEVKVPQKEYDAGNVDKFGKPDPDAVFLCGGGSLPALTTEDGYPRAGDYWETVENGVPTLHVAISDGPSPGWSSVLPKRQIAAQAKVSESFIASSKNHVVATTDYDTAKILDAAFTANDVAKTPTIATATLDATDAARAP